MQSSNSIFILFSLLLASLTYSYLLLSIIPPGIFSFLFLLPVYYIFSLLPWYFDSALLRGLLFFFITWIASSKLILFCFNKGPLIRCQNFLDFAVLSILPMEIRDDPNSSTTSFASLGSAMDRYVVVQLFDKPYIATSLQDYWGKRWNRYASNILRQTVHNPTKEMLTGIIGVRTAKMVSLIFSLVVSGILHEMLFYYITCGKRPTWEVTCYFVVQGVFMVLESALKKWVRIKDWGWTPIHPIVSSMIWPCGFVVVTFFWLLVLPVWRNGQNSCDSN